jgi:hypothetical protein
MMRIRGKLPLVKPIDLAILQCIHELDPTGKSLVYVPERDLDIREFKEVFETIPASSCGTDGSVPKRRDR